VSPHAAARACGQGLAELSVHAAHDPRHETSQRGIGLDVGGREDGNPVVGPRSRDQIAARGIETLEDRSTSASAIPGSV
jgi:hypothetical protein